MLEDLERYLNIKHFEPCFCGSGQKYKKCCRNKTKKEVIWEGLETNFKKLDDYRKSQGGVIKTILPNHWNPIYEKSFNRLRCLYPKCTEGHTECHLIPKNIIKKDFGQKCMELDSIQKKFIEKTPKKAGTRRVFCNSHDQTFDSIDNLNFDWNDEKNLFLCCFKTIPFSLRQTQILLGIDNQLVLKQKSEQNLATLQENHVRFKGAYAFFKEAVKALEQQKWNHFKYYHRIIPSKQIIYFADWINPSHDLYGEKTNTGRNKMITLTCNIFSNKQGINVLLGIPKGFSQKCYSQLLRQISKTNDEDFKSIINNFIAISSNSALLSEKKGKSIDYEDIRKTKEELKNALARNSSSKFNLTRNRICFID